ncbi:hypothetical protein Bbelb_016840 [Branchiostoma belcheri]|nr:hypothetical protein Bbelb_016840 [Branchiostoma belcheri]
MLRRVRSSLSFKLKDKLPIRRTRSHVYAVKDTEPDGLPEPTTRVEKIERLSVTQEMGLQNGPEMEYCGPPSHLERIDEGVTARPKGIGYTVYLASNKSQPARVDSDSDFWSGKSSSESKESVSTVSQASDNEGRDGATDNKQTKDEPDASTNVVRRRKPRRKDDKGLSHLSKEERESILLLEEVLTDFGGWESVRSKAPPPESDSDVDTDEETSAILGETESSRQSGPPSRRSTPSSRRREDGSPAGARGNDRLRTNRAERDKKVTSMIDDNWVLRKPETDPDEVTVVSSVIPRQPRKDSPPKAERPSSMYQFGRQPMYFPEGSNDDIDVGRKPSWVKQNQAWFSRNGHASNGVERPQPAKTSPQKDAKDQLRSDRNGPKEKAGDMNPVVTSSGQSEKITVDYSHVGVTSRSKHEEVQRLSMKVMTSSQHKVASRASSRGMTSEDEYSTDSLSDLTPDTDSSHGSWRRGGPDSLVSSPRTPDSSVPNSPANTYVATPSAPDNTRPDPDASRLNSDVLEESPMKPSLIRKMSTENQLAAFARPTVTKSETRPAPKPLKGLPSKSKSQAGVKPRAPEPPKKSPEPPKKARAPQPPKITHSQAGTSSGNGEATLDFGKQKSVSSSGKDAATSRPTQLSEHLKPPASPSVVVVRNTSPDVTQQNRRPAKEKQPEHSAPKNKTSSGQRAKASNEMRTLKPSQKGAFVTLKHKAPRKRAGGSKRGVPKSQIKTGSDNSKAQGRAQDRYHEQSYGRPVPDRTQYVPVSPERRDQAGSSIVLLQEDPATRRAGAFVIRPAMALYR